MKLRAVFLDRDGVLNNAVIREGKPYPPVTLDELVIVPGAEASLTQLKQHGFLLIVVTNQPDVRRGKTSREQVEQIHAFLSARLPLDEFFACFHDDHDGCTCRKPLPGLIREASLKYDIELGTSYLIGDRWRDIDAGAAAGCRTILIDHRYNEQSPDHSPDKSVSSLAEAAKWILKEEASSELGI